MIDWNALYKIALGLYVLGAKDYDRPVGSLVDAVMIAANKPCAIAVSCNNSSYTKTCIERDGELSISVLGKQISSRLLADFGFQSSRHIDKWNNVKFDYMDGLPVLSDALAQFTAKVIHQYRFESNTLFIAEIKQASLKAIGSNLMYEDYRSYLKDDVIKIFQSKSKENIHV